MIDGVEAIWHGRGLEKAKVLAVDCGSWWSKEEDACKHGSALRHEDALGRSPACTHSITNTSQHWHWQWDRIT